MAEKALDDDRFLAVVDLIRRTGAHAFQIRYSDDEQPVVWMAVARWQMRNGQPVKGGGKVAWETAAGLDPITAVFRLVETIIDGGHCAHCQRPSGVTDDWEGRMPLERHICWYRYDPELKTFRRSCEGEAWGASTATA